MPTQLEQIVVAPGSTIEIPDLSLEGLRDTDRDRLARFFDVHTTADGVLVSTRGKRRVGRVRIGNRVLVAPPPLPPDLFVTLVSFASGDLFERFAARESLPAEIARQARDDSFLKLLAALFVRAAENIVSRYVAREYVARTERLRTIRGRIVFRENFGRHPDSGIACRHSLLETDVLVNRLILAGLITAQHLLRETTWHSRAITQVFLWRGLASEMSPTPLDFELADRKINQMTEHYRETLRTANAVLFGNTPADLLAGTRGRIQALEFDLALLFERLVARLVMMFGRELGLRTRTHQVARRATVNAVGMTYRRAIPDICVFDGQTGRAVIDAKYKPRYLERGGGGRPRAGGRVSNADLYQLFFYQAILSSRNADGRRPSGAIAVPVLEEGQRLPRDEWLRIRWSTDVDERERYEITLIPFRLVPILQSIQDGDRDGLNASTVELQAFLSSLLADRTGDL